MNITPVYDMPSNVTNLLDVFKWGNQATGNAFGMGILFAVFVISYVSLKGYVGTKAFLAASTITLFVSIAFMGAGIVPDLVPVALAVLVVAAMWVVRRQGRYGSR